MPHYDSGLKWLDKNNPLPTDVLWGGGVQAGVKWDLTRYPAQILTGTKQSGNDPAGAQFFVFNLSCNWT